MGAFSMSGGFQNGTGKGRGGAMPLTPSERLVVASYSFLLQARQE